MIWQTMVLQLVDIYLNLDLDNRIFLMDTFGQEYYLTSDKTYYTVQLAVSKKQCQKKTYPG